jgi:glycosyltransferase involved in cell wall biosynthesis
MNNQSKATLKVTIIIPTFNRREKSSRAINSCLKQTYSNIQIVVINDGGDSIDFDKLKLEFVHEPKVEFFSVDHSGHPGKVRNFGFEKSNGEWVAFLDSDDYWEPNKLEIQLGVAAQTGARALCSNAYIAGESKSMFDGSVKAIFSTQDLLTQNWIINSSVLIDRRILQAIGGVVQKVNTVGSEDYATWLRVSTITAWHYSSESLIHYELQSSDSLRFNEELSQLFSRVYAFLDFVEWEKIKNRNSLKLTRVFINVIPKIMKFDLMLIKAISRGKRSTLPE